MQIGATFPQLEINPDPGEIKEYAQAVERMGFKFIMAYDHVIGANMASRPDWKGPYNLASQFFEPFTLFPFLAAVTEKVKLITRVVILPQRQAVLVAKQAACIDVLSRGRMILGIGTGWNEVEYEALGVKFSERGRIYDDQIGVLRELWSKEAVTLKTPYHTVTDAGLNPMPVQRPIPIWMGGGTMRIRKGQDIPDAVLRRIARLADGWIPMWGPDARGLQWLETYRGYCREYGRDPSTIALAGNIDVRAADGAKWAEQCKAWRDCGASHLTINTMDDGLKGAEQHLKRLEEVRKALGD